MAVSENIHTNYSTTASSNTPAGSDSVGADLDDHLRDIKKNIKTASLWPNAHKTAAYTSTVADLQKLVTVEGTYTVSLATAAAVVSGWTVAVKATKPGATVTVDANASETVDDVTAAFSLASQYESVVLASDGSNWFKVANYTPPIPVGSMMPYAGTAAPSGWILCYGQTINASASASYASLFAVIGNTYGGSDINDMAIPDLRGRVIAGQDDMGGTSADRLTNQTGGIDGDTLGATGGAETHTLTAAQLAAHTHTLAGTHTHNVSYDLHSVDNGSQTNVTKNLGTGATDAASKTANSGNTGSTGSDSAHNNVQPAIILNYIMKF